jgi:protein required for attachment to host cells
MTPGDRAAPVAQARGVSTDITWPALPFSAWRNAFRCADHRESAMDKIPPDAWVVVADGIHARILRNVGKGLSLSLRQEQLVEPKNLNDEGPAGRQPPEADVAYIDEATFAKQLAHRLNAAALRNEFSHLVLVADPQTLGQMRPLLHQETAKRIVGELAKTLTNSPVEDIERALKPVA